jgi:hypothetical protein
MKNMRVGAFMGKISGRAELQQNVASVALAVEALELVMVEKGLLKPDELMERIEKLAKFKVQGALNEKPVVLPGAPGMDFELRD